MNHDTFIFNANKKPNSILCLQHQLHNTITDNTTMSLPSYRELHSQVISRGCIVLQCMLACTMN